MKSREQQIETIARSMYKETRVLVGGTDDWDIEPSYIREYFIRRATKIFDKEDDSLF